MNRMGMGLAVGAGYVLGRTKKMKLAFAVGTLVAGRRMRLSPRALAELVSEQLRNNPQFKEIGDQLREDLRGVGSAASGAFLERRADALADRLHGRTEAVRDRIAGVAPDASGFADEDEDADADENYEEGEGADEPGVADEPGEPDERVEGEGPAKRTAKKAPAKKAPGKRAPAKKAAARKTAAKKTAAKKATAKKSAARAPAKKSGPKGPGAAKTAKKAPAKKAAASKKTAAAAKGSARGATRRTKGGDDE
jgi:hypothetical protein